MHTGGPGDEGRENRRDDAPQGAPLPPPSPLTNVRRARSTGEKIGIAILIVVLGIPLGLLVFGALLFGACLLGSR